ncbi:MAG: calcium-translocating P-type ATPase, PMCA-type [Bacilli bacterium]|nr:calcium-translocating P-type ATPase, PMCA-type [Bacilli bacterium]
MNGLNNEQVLKSRKENGTNSITQTKKNSFLKLLYESLADPIIRILLIALAIKVLFLFKDFDIYETIGILIAVFLASFISSVSEYGSEAAFEKLQEEASKIKAKVWRQNKLKEIPIEEIVVGDYVSLQSGDKVPADGYLFKGNLSVDESSLNGEKKEAKKFSVLNKINPPTEANKIYRGAVVYSGEATMIVTSVGDKTIYGKLAKELQEKNPTSPLKLRLRGLANVISKIGYIGAGLVTLSYLFAVIFIKNNFDKDLILSTLTNFQMMSSYLLYALTLSVTIIVVAVPEGLPMMITLVLSSNMKRMLKDNVLVRKLVGIETAGSLNVLLTDKTGTLTKGELEVSVIYSPDLTLFNSIKDLERFKPYHELIIENLYYNNESKVAGEKIIGGNMTDQALLNYVKDAKVNNFGVINKILFDSSKKYSAVTITKGNGFTYFKGATEVILSQARYYVDKFGKKSILLKKDNLENKIKDLTKKGNRVILLAYNDTSDKLNGCTILGIVCIKDELRKEAKEGISLIKSAGIHTIMITGDALDTAKNIAMEVGLIDDANDLVLTSNDLNNLSDDEIKKVIMHIKVIARALPSDKSRLVKILEDMELIVGMTGDGVNDAPALKKADVGFAMGSGTEVAKEAADIIILDNNILSISKAILYGRTIFKSIRKFIIYQLTVNMCALVLSIVGPFIGIDTPITIIQMLWLNMIMDTFAGLAFSFEPPLKEYMKEPPKAKNEPIMNSYMYGEIFFTGLYSAILCILFLKLPIIKTFIRTGPDNIYLMTAYFALFIFIGIFNSFNARSQRLNILGNITKNKVFIVVIAFIVSVQIYLIYHGGDLFRTYGLHASEFAFVLILAFTVIPVDFIRKTILRKKHLKTGV